METNILELNKLNIKEIEANNRKKKEKVPKIPGFRIENRTEQTRFHFRMDLCIGCHSCEVACAEQNNLPAELQWRRVGEVEAGKFPDTKRFYLSSGCNHCLDAPCMKGCPVDAYQVTDKGIIMHVDDTCIGCGYCTWNCPYGVPVYQEDRHIVTKCDLCKNRLDDNLQTACVQACPASAIEVETVPIIQILNEYKINGRGPDMPPPEISIPSTKITLPKGMKTEDFLKVNRGIVKPEKPHYSLVMMTVLTQVAFGGFLVSFLTDVMRQFMSLPKSVHQSVAFLAPILLGVAGISLAASTMHLGRPIFAYRAIKMWRTSWLSREVIGLTLFAKVAALYSVMLFLADGPSLIELPFSIPAEARTLTGLFTVFSGIIGIYASSMIYRVPSRPAWNSKKTTFDFFFTAILCGPMLFSFAASLAGFISGDSTFLGSVTSSVAGFVLIAGTLTSALNSYLMRRRKESGIYELEQSVELYEGKLFRVAAFQNLLRGLGLLFSFLILIDFQKIESLAHLFLTGGAFLFLLGSLLLSRYLFFVTVVPRNIPGNFLIEASKEG